MEVFEGSGREIQLFLLPNLSQLQHSCRVFRLNYDSVINIHESLVALWWSAAVEGKATH